MSGSYKLSNRQIIILRLIALAHRKGLVWVPQKSEKLDGKEILIGGGSDAQVIKALIRGGLVTQVGNMPPYTCEITNEGLEWIKVLEH